MKKIGVLVDKLEVSQLSFLIMHWFNKLHDKPGYDCVLFYNEPTPFFDRIKFSCMNISESFNFDGLLISTDHKSTKIMMNTIPNSQKVFYMWDLEWLRSKQDYLDLNKIYNSDLNLVTRSTNYSDVLANYCNRQARVIEHFNIEQISDEFSNNTS